jgi:serine/threonine protein phosphatase PrpC
VEEKGNGKYIRALGIEWKLEVLLKEGKTYKGDVFLIMSDGAKEVFSIEELSHILSEDIEESARVLLKTYRDTLPTEDLSFAIVRVD